MDRDRKVSILDMLPSIRKRHVGFLLNHGLIASGGHNKMTLRNERENHDRI